MAVDETPAGLRPTDRPRDFCTVAEWVAFWLSRAAPPTAEQRARANAALGIRTRTRADRAPGKEADNGN